MEEDPILDMNTFIENNKSLDLKISNEIEKTENDLSKLFSVYDPNIKEIDYKYYCKINSIKKTEEYVKIDKESLKTVDNIEKMKSIGKLYLKKNSKFTKYSDKVDSTFFNSRFEAQENFPTISSENCVYKGHWCYEVTLITNGLFQIGFSQLNTVCNRTSGVGDGMDSYSFDGYRVTSWNKNQKKYGKPWDIGDVIGVAIDLEERTIEFFLNGEKLGIAFENINIGPNVTYFPSVTFSNTQKCYVNLGQYKYKYEYKNSDGTPYEHFDIPSCKITNLYFVTTELLKKYLDISKLENEEFSFTYLTIFDYISNHSCSDFYCMKEVIIPYLLEILESKSEKAVIRVIAYLLQMNNNKSSFISRFVETLFFSLESLLIQGESKIDLAFLNSQLIQIALQFDSIAINWVENCMFEKHIKAILKINNTNLKENLIKYIELNFTISASVADYKGKLAYNTNEEYYIKYSKLFFNLISFFMKDKLILDKSKQIDDLKKKLKNEYSPELPLLKQIFLFAINHCYELEKNINFNQFLSLEKELSSYDIENLCTTFLFPLIHQLIHEKLLFIENLNVYPWIKRSEKSSWFYDDIGIGGTINSTTETFGKYLETYTKLNNHKDITYEEELIHRVLKLSSVLFKSMSNLKKYNENLSIAEIKIENHGCELLYDSLRIYDNIYSFKNQQLIYFVGIFVIKLIENFREISPNLIYFIPKFIIEIPLKAFSLLRNINSKVLYNSLDNVDILEKLNLDSTTFHSSLLSMASEFLYDENINNPEIIEILLQNINMIISFDETIDFLSNNKQVLTKVLKGTSKYISHDIYGKITSSIVFTILKPICFGNNKNAKTFVMKQGIKECFIEDFDFFNKFMDSYTELLNKNLTKYYMTIEEIITSEKKLKNYGGDANIIVLYFKSLLEIMTSLESVLSLYEAIIQTAPDILIPKSLTFTRFCVLLSNLSSRFLGYPYYKECQEVSNKHNSKEYIQVFIKLFYILITFSNCFTEMKNKDIDSDIQEKIMISLSKSDINTENLMVFVEDIKKNDLFKHDFKNEFFCVLEFIKNLEQYNKELLKNSKEIDEEKLCLICCNAECDVKLIPCHHTLCRSCSSVYKRNNKFCFICKQEILGEEDIQFDK